MGKSKKNKSYVGGIDGRIMRLAKKVHEGKCEADELYYLIAENLNSKPRIKKLYQGMEQSIRKHGRGPIEEIIKAVSYLTSNFVLDDKNYVVSYMPIEANLDTSVLSDEFITELQNKMEAKGFIDPVAYTQILPMGYITPSANIENTIKLNNELVSIYLKDRHLLDEKEPIIEGDELITGFVVVVAEIDSNTKPSKECGDIAEWVAEQLNADVVSTPTTYDLAYEFLSNRENKKEVEKFVAKLGDEKKDIVVYTGMGVGITAFIINSIEAILTTSLGETITGRYITEVISQLSKDGHNVTFEQ